MTAYIAYLRVSTREQERSGLGLDAQTESIKRFLQSGDVLLGTYTEIESGRCDERPQLTNAIARCQVFGATLLIAKLDRLSRKVSFLSALMDGDVPFVAADNPHATRFTLHILAAVAEHEAHAISERTRSALAAAKVRGQQLGGWRGRGLSADDRTQGMLARIDRAKRRAKLLAPLVLELRTLGLVTFRQLAYGLNERGISAPRGGRWSGAQVRAMLLHMQPQN